MSKNIVIIIVSLVLVTLVSCEYNYIKPDTGEPVNPEDPISFSEQVEPIWTSQSCVNCHNGSGLFSLKPGEAFQSLTVNNLLDKENADNSKILTVPGSTGIHSNFTYVSNQATLIKVWIEQGAEDN